MEVTCGMRVIYESAEGRVTDLGLGLYEAGGRLFYIEPGTLDASDPETASRLLLYAKQMGMKGTVIHGACGFDDVCRMQLSPYGGVLAEGCCVRELPEDVRELARETLDRVRGY